MERSMMGASGCCNSGACSRWIKMAGYDPDESFPDNVCERCGYEGPYYLYHQAQEYGWGGGEQVREQLRILREERGEEVERLFQYVVNRLISKVNFKGMADTFAAKLGDREKAETVCRSVLTLAVSGIEMSEDDEQAKEYYDKSVEGRVPMELAVFSQFRKLLENEMHIWFRARGLLLIGESCADVENYLREALGD